MNRDFRNMKFHTFKTSGNHTPKFLENKKKRKSDELKISYIELRTSKTLLSLKRKESLKVFQSEQLKI